MLDRFTPATQDWFRGAFPAPTPAQAGAWDAISAGKHALVVAPTGSGKTLSAFLWAIDSVFRERMAETSAPVKGEPRTRILYISPLKALGVDVERNLRSPLIGIGQSARRLGVPSPAVTVGVHLVDDHGVYPAQGLARPAREHEVERLGGRDEDVGRI